MKKFFLISIGFMFSLTMIAQGNSDNGKGNDKSKNEKTTKQVSSEQKEKEAKEKKRKGLIFEDFRLLWVVCCALLCVQARVSSMV